MPPAPMNGNADDSRGSGVVAASAPPPVVRRNTLPAHGSPESPSVMGTILKRSLGKDLGSVSMPVSVAEPLSLLQKLAEAFDYSHLLTTTCTISSVYSRLVFLAAFIVSSLSSQSKRTSRKPFNPLLGETFELIREDLKFRFLAEKTVHHPTTVAWICESMQLVDCGDNGKKPHWTVWQDYQVKSKLRGTSIDLENEGSPVHVTLRGIAGKDAAYEEEYVFMPPEATITNVISGTKDLIYTGEVELINLTTRELALISFDDSHKGSRQRTFTGKVSNIKGVEILGLEGHWDKDLVLTDPTHKQPPRPVWKAKEFPADAGEYYGFSMFARQLNEITSVEAGEIPPTDSRLRPDQQLLEHGQLDKAEEVKERLENAQRERRKDMESRKVSWRPRWFVLKEDKHRNLFREKSSATDKGVGMSWQYAGGYWEARENGWQGVDIPKLW